MYEYDPRTRTDEGILRLCKEIKEKWSGTMTPPQQYGLNDAWNKINQAEVCGCSCVLFGVGFSSDFSKKAKILHVLTTRHLQNLTYNIAFSKAIH